MKLLQPQVSYDFNGLPFRLPNYKIAHQVKLEMKRAAGAFWLPTISRNVQKKLCFVKLSFLLSLSQIDRSNMSKNKLRQMSHVSKK